MNEVIIAVVTAAAGGFTAYLVAIIKHRQEMAALLVSTQNCAAENAVDLERLRAEIHASLLKELRAEIDAERERRRVDRAEFEALLVQERQARQNVEQRLSNLEIENTSLRAELARYGSSRL
jgi:septal ring factor EnvC (AmiA/AmiB activator)